MTIDEYRKLILEIDASKAKMKGTAQRKRDSNVNSENHPERILLSICQKVFGEQIRKTRPLSNRKFEIDAADERLKLGFELDGYRYHGLSKSGFHRDREKDRLLTLAGWRIFRFSAKQVKNDPWGVEIQLREIKSNFDIG